MNNIFRFSCVHFVQMGNSDVYWNEYTYSPYAPSPRVCARVHPSTNSSRLPFCDAILWEQEWISARYAIITEYVECCVFCCCSSGDVWDVGVWCGVYCLWLCCVRIIIFCYFLLAPLHTYTHIYTYNPALQKSSAIVIMQSNRKRKKLNKRFASIIWIVLTL